MMSLFKKLFGDYSEKEIKRMKPLQAAVLALEDEYRALSDAELRAKTELFRERYQNGESLDSLLPEAFATCREAGDRVLGMRHFPVQILGGIALHQGRISEMHTGEGKTLVATLPAYLNALSGKGVHIVTVNDYLAKRDSEWMGKIYRFLGLSVGLIVHGMSGDEKREAYAADITYCTNNELGFDYLRDNMVLYREQRVQRGHNYAIVDEVDSILIDEARTPLIISGKGDKSTELYQKANRFVRGLRAIRIVQNNDKEINEQHEREGDYIVDEKSRSCSLTASGTKKAEEYFGIENLSDAENITIAHHINQAIRAHGIMQRDVDYVVKDGQVIIVDEFTGRLMFGRRYNEGLHQAIEAKEGVTIENESKTLASITFQNYFRLYDKLAGMTGTAETEAGEFGGTYNLDVVVIPSNKEVIREDGPDLIFKSQNGKTNAIIEKIIECNQKGQPVLVGTVTIEKSEELSAKLRHRGIKHNVLNAKHHEREAEIIAQAGKFGAVTIATNMAGRGTDIMLGGNAEYLAKAELKKLEYTDEIISEATGFAETADPDILKARSLYNELYDKFRKEIAPEAEKVRAVGGLCIIGTERHDSRRIDNQLRGRAGRQGDPGNTQFYLSLEDDLLRLFTGERMLKVMSALGIDDDTPIASKMVTNALESAQLTVEERNSGIRKSVLEYDDVMNKQRELIYKQRNSVLDNDNVHDMVMKMIHDTIDIAAKEYLTGESADEWNLSGLRDHFLGWITTEEDLAFTADELNTLEPEDVAEMLKTRADEIMARRMEEYGEKLMFEMEKVMLLRSVDRNWMDHIDSMDELKNGIGLRAYGQHNPVVEYRNESYDMFNAMSEAIREQTARLVLTVRIRRDEEIKREKVAEESAAPASKTVKGKGVVGKNALCPCGSGKKYKRCCGKDID
ncbi:MAG: preprotein translocase subunit SecA [Ruminococcaceae bacterium]|nr:preprotein translocase subunit SecA [Oscillospiraceae bacterium]